MTTALGSTVERVGFFANLPAVHEGCTLQHVLDGITGINTRLDRMENRIADIDHRLNEVQTDMNRRFDDVNRRLDDMKTGEHGGACNYVQDRCDQDAGGYSIARCTSLDLNFNVIEPTHMGWIIR